MPRPVVCFSASVGFGQSSAKGKGCVHLWLKVCNEASGTAACWPMGGAWS